MRKNLITVIILAICIINLVFNILLVFVFMPSANKTNKLITDIAEVLDLEIASQSSGDGSGFDVSNLAAFELEQGNPINLASDGSDKIHALQYGITINLDSTAGDYQKVLETLQASTSLIYDMTRDIIANYTYDQVIDVEVQRQIKEQILQKLKETFNTECIYSVSFYNWVAQ
ncbi:MAG: flagellar basal body-associated FliL family protein [Lachnospiraceae bacterium]|nr:flagellar basal body-associated FliL family protein [Lachnospiraceae bacterium]MBQ8924540.1 flagellar basal body-associated FliL family protein [Lachnospiraceae bacterium]